MSGAAIVVSNATTPSSPGLMISSTPQKVPDPASHRGNRRIAGPMAHRITLIPGDGIGPELTEATRRVLEATGVAFEWDVQAAGAEVMAEHDGNPPPDDTPAPGRPTRV